MKYLLLAILLCLIFASEETWRHLPDTRSPVPVITWVTDNNPARSEQVALFQKWLEKVKGPPGKLELDMANGEDTKEVIQGVSGVGGDVMDVYSMTYFNAIGILAEVTDSARELGFGLDHTYPAIEPEIAQRDNDGRVRQYLFPCNVVPWMLVVNREALHRYHQPIPPRRWTVEEFETLGKAFVDAANVPGQARDHFYCAPLDLATLRRSFGVAEFDETQTHCTLDDPRYVQVLKLMDRWHEMHILPSLADAASFSTGTAYGGADEFLFSNGNYALLPTGRHMVIQFRKDNLSRVARGEPPLDLTVSEPPNGGFAVAKIDTRAAGLYRGGSKQRLASYFLAFLASDEYNRQIIRDGDALPPDPKWTASEEFLHPSQDPARGVYQQTEWDFHGPFAEAALNIAVGGSYSPFVLDTTVLRENNDAVGKFLDAHTSTAESAVPVLTAKINAEIQRTLSENPSLRPKYDMLCERQKQIDQLKAAGKKIPLKWIADPFRRAYEQSQGLTE